jgi:hypothetical protein
MGVWVNLLLRGSLVCFLAEVMLRPDDPRFVGKAIPNRNLLIVGGLSLLFPVLFGLKRWPRYHGGSTTCTCPYSGWIWPAIRSTSTTATRTSTCCLTSTAQARRLSWRKLASGRLHWRGRRCHHPPLRARGAGVFHRRLLGHAQRSGSLGHRGRPHQRLRGCHRVHRVVRGPEATTRTAALRTCRPRSAVGPSCASAADTHGPSP